MPSDVSSASERERLERVYAQRDAAGVDAVTWSWLRPEAHWLDVAMQQFLLSALTGHGWTPQTVAQCRVLEVGCGTGRVLRWCYEAGVRSLWGCELVAARAMEARQTTPFAHIVQADMGRLPFPDGTFDHLVQVATFSSCLDEALRQAAAREMLRVLRNDGCILWWDLLPQGARTDYLQGLTRQDLRWLFPDTHIEARPLGVNPQWLGAVTSLINQGPARLLLRRVPGWRQSAWAARRPIKKIPRVAGALLSLMPWSTWHLGAVIRKQPPR